MQAYSNAWMPWQPQPRHLESMAHHPRIHRWVGAQDWPRPARGGHGRQRHRPHAHRRPNSQSQPFPCQPRWQLAARAAGQTLKSHSAAPLPPPTHAAGGTLARHSTLPRACTERPAHQALSLSLAKNLRPPEPVASLEPSPRGWPRWIVAPARQLQLPLLPGAVRLAPSRATCPGSQQLLRVKWHLQLLRGHCELPCVGRWWWRETQLALPPTSHAGQPPSLLRPLATPHDQALIPARTAGPGPVDHAPGHADRCSRSAPPRQRQQWLSRGAGFGALGTPLRQVAPRGPHPLEPCTAAGLE